MRLLVPYTPEIGLIGSLFDQGQTIGMEQDADRPLMKPIGEIKESMVDTVPVHLSDEQIDSQQLNNRNNGYLEYIWFIWIFGAFLLFASKVFQYGRFISGIRTEASIVIV